MQRIYLDHAATTPVRAEALDAMAPWLSAHNPSSVHTEGRAARQALDAARERVAAVLGARPKEIVFTATGSESDNLAIAGAARAAASRGRHLVSVVTEHHAVLHSFAALEREGWEVSLLPVDPSGQIGPERFASALRPDTVLASVAYANNEIGSIAPIPQLAKIARDRGVLFHTDAVQAAPYLPFNVGELGVDLLTLAAHKFYGPKGAGVLYVRTGTPIEPIVHGGGQEFGRRAGTENVAAIAGMSVALELAVAERAETVLRAGALRDRFEAVICERIADVKVNGAGGPRLPNNVNLSILGVDSDALLTRLDLDGIAASAGSACTSGVVEPSHVIAALGIEPAWQRGVIRLTLGRSTTEDEIIRAEQLLREAVAALRHAFGFSKEAERGIVGSRPGVPGGGLS